MNTQIPAASDPGDEAGLVLAVQGGDVHAFDPLVERHLEAVHAFVALKLPVPHLVDEITHESFVFAFHHIGDFTPGTTFRGWLKAIAFNKVRAEIERHLRDQRNRLAYSERRELEDALAQTPSADAIELEALQDCLRLVPDRLRALIQLRYHDDQSSEEIASRVGRSLAWVRTTLCRIRRQLRDCIERKLKVQPS